MRARRPVLSKRVTAHTGHNGLQREPLSLAKRHPAKTQHCGENTTQTNWIWRSTKPSAFCPSADYKPGTIKQGFTNPRRVPRSL